MTEHFVNALNTNLASNWAGPGIFSILLIAVAAYFIFFLTALVDMLGARIGCGAKILWFLVIFAMPFLGSLLWYVVGRKTIDPPRGERS
ncbi:PLD nuclease N-terminal domain-containing protein [Amycolatopsis minnesotensis]|uniref:Cardiolipin synthase N-terminal domain-containing protein n=1 Tax=Amycolatopsis minnesotensis TaxID=337894 RepID=A0ABP5CAE0_9PSEU